MPGPGSWQLSSADELHVLRAHLFGSEARLVAMTRIRNEELILADSLDHVGCFADAILVFDDASTDRSFDIACAHAKVALVVRNSEWKPGSEARLLAETRHRGLLLEQARLRFPNAWFYYFDADERLVGDVCPATELAERSGANGLRVRLFDAYMTPSDCKPFQGGLRLLDFRAWFGPERRDILMIWKNDPAIRFVGLDAREPNGARAVVSSLCCQHYGKSLSLAHWEETCDYYATHFPEEPYGRKWRERRGKAIHVLSDFGRPLYRWGPELFSNAVIL